MEHLSTLEESLSDFEEGYAMDSGDKVPRSLPIFIKGRSPAPSEGTSSHTSMSEEGDITPPIRRMQLEDPFLNVIPVRSPLASRTKGKLKLFKR